MPRKKNRRKEIQRAKKAAEKPPASGGTIRGVRGLKFTSIIFNELEAEKEAPHAFGGMQGGETYTFRADELPRGNVKSVRAAVALLLNRIK